MKNAAAAAGEERDQAKPRKKSPIADLPEGISVHKLGNGSFRVRLGKKFTRNQAIAKDFSKLQAARDWIAEQSRDCVALRQMELTPDQVAQAKAALTRLGKIPLMEAVDFYLKNSQANLQSTKISTAIDLYLEKHKKGGSKENYRKAQKISLSFLQKTWEDRILPEETPEKSEPAPETQNLNESDIDYDLDQFTAKELDLWFTQLKAIKRWGDLNTLNYVRDLKMFFRFCVRRNLLGSNPMEDPIFDWVKPLRKKVKQNHEVVIYSIEEVEKILSAALTDDDRDMLVWFTIAFFSGIRVDEMTRLTWDHFQWDAGAISLSKADVAKRGDPRHIKFNCAFEAWVEKVPDFKTLTGPIIDPVNWRHRLDKFHARAQVPKKRNALRHTFASYHYVKFGDADATRKILGQKTADVLFDHYVHLVPEKDAQTFWQLKPKPKKIKKSALCHLTP